MPNTPEQWEEEFDEIFLYSADVLGDPALAFVNTPNIIQDTSLIKDFIRKEKQKSYEQGKKDAVEEIIKKIKTSGLIFETFTIDTVMGILESSLTPNQNSV